ncbi:MAG: ATP-binding cassette domain-containing protein [Actinobacteria bacterium]|nr:ATP-binding cassette domain-containing protein [Actinomycetota bacterium]
MIRVENLYKDLGEFTLRGVNLEVGDGDYLIVLGPTGAGKTILLETMAGIYSPDEGRIFLDEQEITDIPPRKRNIGMVYQDYMLFPHLKVEANIRFGLKSRKVDKTEARRRTRELAELFNISHLLHRYPGTLSGGEQQRVAIARALIVEPKVLLLDEPLSALDASTRTKLREELKRIHSMTDTIMVHVTHSFDEAFLLGNRMAIMNEGRIVQVGETGEVFRKPNSRFVADFVGTTNIFQGRSTRQNGISWVSIDDIKVASAVAAEGNVYTTVRPESILVSLHPMESSARNNFKGRIENICDEGGIVKIEVDVGIPFISTITRRSYTDMELYPGKEVYITFKATDVHLFDL